MSESLLTVAIPVYNAMPYLPQAVESILGQTYRDFRLLIINDGSTDESAQYLNSLADPRVTVVHQENRGSGVTAQRTLELCTTPLYARMDADDIALPKRLALQVDHMQCQSRTSLVAGQIDFLIDGVTLQAPHLPESHEQIVEALMRARPVVSQPAMMVRTQWVKQVGGYRIANAGQDFDLFLRLSDVGRLVNLPDKLLQYRIHMSSLSTRRKDELHRGIAYAIHCKRSRMNGEVEPSVDQFFSEWDKRPLFTKWQQRLHDAAALAYRRSMVCAVRGQKMRRYCYLAKAAAMRPVRAMEVAGRYREKVS